MTSVAFAFFCGRFFVHRDVLALLRERLLVVLLLRWMAQMTTLASDIDSTVTSRLVVMLPLLLKHVVERRSGERDSSVVFFLAELAGQLQGARSVLCCICTLTCVTRSFDRTWS